MWLRCSLAFGLAETGESRSTGTEAQQRLDLSFYSDQDHDSDILQECRLYELIGSDISCLVPNPPKTSELEAHPNQRRFPTKLSSKKIQRYRPLYDQRSKMVWLKNHHIIWWGRKDSDDTSYLIIVVGTPTERRCKFWNILSIPLLLWHVLWRISPTVVDFVCMCRTSGHLLFTALKFVACAPDILKTWSYWSRHNHQPSAEILQPHKPDLWAIIG